MVSLNNVTLVSVTSVNVDRTVRALKHSMKGISFSEVLLLTDKEVSPSGIKTIKIDTLDYIGYSHFIVYELYKHINTDFVLIIQDDGFVTNPEKWTDEFLNYEYISETFKIKKQDDKISYRDTFGKLKKDNNKRTLIKEP